MCVFSTLTKRNYISHLTLRLLRHTPAQNRRGNRKRGKHAGLVTLKLIIGRSGQHIDILTETLTFIRLLNQYHLAADWLSLVL